MWRVGVMLLLPLLLTGCAMSYSAFRVATLVLLPIVLVIILLWFLLGRSDEEDWQATRLPDDEDDNRDDFLVMAHPEAAAGHGRRSSGEGKNAVQLQCLWCAAQ